MIDETKLKNAIIETQNAKLDWSGYDYDDIYVPDEEYHGWQNALNYLLDVLKIEITEEDYEKYYEEENKKYEQQI